MGPPTIHGTVVALGTRGLLLLGAPGRGKSGLALALIERGAMLVADDRVGLSARDGQLMATPAPALAGLLEVRGVGLLRMPYRREVAVRLLLDLDAAPERLPPSPADWARRDLLGVAVPILPLAAEAPLAALKVEAALAVLEGR
jgi:serine kinase of HPr protein (carbohydrate metabolism regulator)